VSCSVEPCKLWLGSVDGGTVRGHRAAVGVGTVRGHRATLGVGTVWRQRVAVGGGTFRGHRAAVDGGTVRGHRASVDGGTIHFRVAECRLNTNAVRCAAYWIDSSCICDSVWNYAASVSLFMSLIDIMMCR